MKQKQDVTKPSEEIVDPRDPNVKHAGSLIVMVGFDWILVAIGALCASVVGIIPLLFFMTVGSLQGSLATASADAIQNEVNNIGLSITYIAIGAFFSAFLGQFFLKTGAARISQKLKTAFFKSVMTQEVGYFDIKSSGFLLKNLTEDVTKVMNVFTTDLFTLSQNIGQVIAGVILALQNAWQTGLLGYTSVPLMVFVIVIAGRIIAFLSARGAKQLGDSVSTANEVIGAMKTVRSMAGEQKEMSRYAENLKKVRFTGIATAFTTGFSLGSSMFFMWGAMTMALWWAGRLMSSGDITIANLTRIWGYLLLSVMGIQNFLNTIPNMVKAQNSLRILLNVIKRDPAIKYKGGVKPDTLKGHIVIDNVTFRYPSRPKVIALKNFSLEILPTTSVALVGASGSGKSTIVGLLEKWYEPEAGSITIDGVDIRTIDSEWLHTNIGIVSQEPTLFAGTIRKNITYAVDTVNFNIRTRAEAAKVPEEDIERMLVKVDENIILEAAKAANAHDFITRLPNGYDTVIGERGVSLSGGQKQRIAIARAVLQKPSILLLDEATSALDSKSESLVQDALDKLMEGKTSIVVAHRLSTIQNCNKIIVMKQGQIIETGTHDELIDKPDGAYQSLALKQQITGIKGSRSSQNLSTSSSADDLSSSEDANFKPNEQLQSEDVKTDTSDVLLTVSSVTTPQDEEEKKIVKKKKRRFGRKKNLEEFKNVEEVADAREPKVRTIFPIFKIMGPELIFILIAMLCSAATGCVVIMFQYVFGQLINSISPLRNSDGSFIPYKPGYSYADSVAYWCQFLAIIAGCSGVTQFCSSFFSNMASERVSARIKRAYFNAIVNQEMGFFDIKRPGKLLSSLAEDVHGIQEGFTTTIAMLTQFMAQFTCGVVFAFISSWTISLMMLGVGIGTTLIIAFVGSGVMRFMNKKEGETSASATVTASEVIGSIRTVRSMAGEDREMRRFSNDLVKLFRVSSIKAVSDACMFGSFMFCMWGNLALANWYGGGLVGKGQLLAGTLTQTTSNMLFGIMGLSMGMFYAPNVFKAIQSSKEILRVIERKPAIPLNGGDCPTEQVEGKVEFSNIKFAYPSRPNVVVMKNFSLTIESGQHVALVGESGCGKSTITGLLERFYDPLEGTVKLDGRDLKNIDPEWIHKNIAIVTQEPVLFNTSIKRNITYAIGDDKANMDEIVEASKAANAHDFIMTLPDGYDTVVGERGVSMSGGQKQRIAIARAMLQKASILLLDEATSALDTEAEALVQQALDRLMVGSTSIVIAHRLSTVKNCDLIVVMDAGAIVETGTHDELIEKGGVYAKLAQKQMLQEKH